MNNNNTKKPLILISNDDGITAKGLRVLVETMCSLGEVLVVAPNTPQSGMGHAITIHSPLKIHRSSIFNDLGVEAYESSGTPADCIKLAKYYVLKNRVPDLVASGINHGSNTSISVLYSGTMSAAIEGAIEGMPAIGFSLCDYEKDADFSHIIPYVSAIAQQVLKTGLPKGTALNVNFPRRQQEPIKGIKICRQARARWKEEFDERTDPYGRKYLWLAGSFENSDKGEDTDEWAIANNYVSVVPCLFDLTDHHAIATLNYEWEILRETAPRIIKEHYDNF
ncbi:MAG: 5'/3'-nucleotidase SurE [Cytophagales bacterium]|nr:5'/3'-nucleotidase SurE [Bernardetiaceae bacterium]MDW8209535.1 5'/3'-nucleotidase SurE [Cytophagales bacterium]